MADLVPDCCRCSIGNTSSPTFTRVPLARFPDPSCQIYHEGGRKIVPQLTGRISRRHARATGRSALHSIDDQARSRPRSSAEVSTSAVGMNRGDETTEPDIHRMTRRNFAAELCQFYRTWPKWPVQNLKIANALIVTNEVQSSRHKLRLSKVEP